MNLNPRQIIANILNKNQNPMINNLIGMAKNGDTQGVENFARNLFNERGRDFDKEFAEFMNKVKR